MEIEVDIEFQNLCKTYSHKLPSKIHDIELSLNELVNSFSSKKFMDFSSLIHNLNGSAGIYGYTEISKLANQIETILSRFDYDIQLDKSGIEKIRQIILELNKEIILLKKEPEITSVKKVNTSLIYLLHSGQDYSFGKTWANSLVDQLKIFNYELIIFNDINIFISELKANNPLAIIVDFDLINNPFEINLNDQNIKDALTLYFKNNHTIFISKSGEIDKRLMAVRLKGKNFLTLPFNNSELVLELNNLKKQWVDAYKVIIVDNDKEILNYYTNLLTNYGIKVAGISSYKEIEKILHEFNPDLLILDLNMDDCNGVELATIIRQQQKYEYIPIIYLSTEENKNIQLKAMDVGADDFMTKQTDPNVILETIRMRANRYTKIKLSNEKDHLTGAFDFDYILKKLKIFTEKYASSGRTLTIGIAKIDNFEVIKNNYSYDTADQLLKALYVFLNNQLDFSRLVGLFKKQQFIIIFPDTNYEKAKEEMNRLQDKFKTLLHYVNGKTYSSSFKMGFASYQNKISLEKLIDEANNQLK